MVNRLLFRKLSRSTDELVRQLQEQGGQYYTEKKMKQEKLAFWDGFEKQAEEKGGFLEKAKQYAAPVLGTAAAIGAYKYLRKSRGKKPLTWILEGGPKKKGIVSKSIDKALYGADDIKYVQSGAKIPKKPQKVKGTVIHTGETDPKFYKGQTNIGDISGSRMLKRLEKDKAYEAAFIQKHAPKFYTPTMQTSHAMRGKKGLTKIHEKFKRKGYLIKPMEGYGSGVGGKAFIRASHVTKFLKGEKLEKGMRKKVEQFLRKPKGHVIQKEMRIKKGPISRQPRELRVHAVGGKVVPKGATIRGGNIEDIPYIAGAEKYFQKFLDKLPKYIKKKNIAWAPDIAKTPEGYRIIELNAGQMASGLVDPKFMAQKGMIPAASALRITGNIYKALTGRHAPIQAATKATGIGAGAFGISKQLIDKKEQGKS